MNSQELRDKVSYWFYSSEYASLSDELKGMIDDFMAEIKEHVDYVIDTEVKSGYTTEELRQAQRNTAGGY